MARPRVFVSSTYYDLKYVRERIERFIQTYNMDPILFESDEIYFNPNNTIDNSCYNEIGNCQMMILIIGGRYGSIASTKDEYEKNYVSITQKEYKTAKSKGVPVMICVDSNVYSEYKTYQKNRNSLPKGFEFAHVDDIRVFEFVSSVEQQAIKTFSKIEDIEQYFANQISGMLYTYLVQLQNDKVMKDIGSAVDQINHVSSSMQEMLNLIAQKVLGRNNEQYETLIRQQNHDLIDFFIELFEQNVTLYNTIESTDDINLNTIMSLLMSTLFNPETIHSIKDLNDIKNRFKLVNELEQQTITAFAQTYPTARLPKLEINNYVNQLIKINDLINSDEELKAYFKNKLSNSLLWLCL